MITALNSHRIHATQRRILSPYQAIAKSLWDQTYTAKKVSGDLSQSYLPLETKTAQIMEIFTIFKGLETNANVNTAQSNSANKVPVSLSSSQFEMINQFLKEYQITIPKLSEAPLYTLPKKEGFTVDEAIALSGTFQTLSTQCDMQITASQSQTQQVFENFRRVMGYISNFEKRSFDMKNHFAIGFRSIVG